MPFEAARILSTAELRALIIRLGAKIGLSEARLGKVDEANDFAAPFIFSTNRYHWVVREHGQEVQHKTTTDLDQLLYWMFENVTHGLASDFALEHREPQQDFRRMLFQKQLDLIEKLEPSWRHRLATRLNDILSDAPFADNAESKTVS
jgi:hypothetical protein